MTASTKPSVGPTEPETILAHSSTVACDGGVGPLGHPRVFLTFSGSREVSCPYCSRTYVLAEGVKDGHGH